MKKIKESNIHIRSEKSNELLGDIPKKIVYLNSIVIFTIIIILILCLCIIPYPYSGGESIFIHILYSSVGK